MIGSARGRLTCEPQRDGELRACWGPGMGPPGLGTGSKGRPVDAGERLLDVSALAMDTHTRKPHAHAAEGLAAFLLACLATPLAAPRGRLEALARLSTSPDPAFWRWGANAGRRGARPPRCRERKTLAHTFLAGRPPTSGQARGK